jgi:hypothetical protein
VATGDVEQSAEKDGAEDIGIGPRSLWRCADYERPLSMRIDELLDGGPEGPRAGNVIDDELAEKDLSSMPR